MGYLVFTEKVKSIDMFLLLISFAGVYLIGVGFKDKNFKHHDELNQKVDLARAAPPLWALIGLLILPFMSSTSNLLLRTLNKMHENTTSLYTNPFMVILMF